MNKEKSKLAPHRTKKTTYPATVVVHREVSGKTFESKPVTNNSRISIQKSASANSALIERLAKR